MTYTTDQQNALKNFQEFLHSNKNIFLLRGSAGSGKTTLMKELILSLPTKNDSAEKNYTFSLMAPTGRAAFILSQKTGHVASTIHRAIYEVDKITTKQDKDNGEIDGKLRFNLKENHDPQNTIYFIDEASMVSDSFNDNDQVGFGSGYLLQDLLTYCGKRKIVFVGDYVQLPPVGQTISPALEKEYLERNYNCQIEESVLREVVRQDKNSGIYSNATTLRDAVEREQFNEFRISCNNSDVIHSDSLLADYTSTCGNRPNDNSIIITYSNSQALEYNQKVRNHFFQNDPERLRVGDLLIVSRNSYYFNVELFNGTIVNVTGCLPDDTIERRSVRFYSTERDTNGKTKTIEMELAFRDIEIETPTHERIKCKILDNFIDEPSGEMPQYLTQALTVDFDNRKPSSLKKGSPEYFDALRQDPYYNTLLCKYGYAITCHKAQGGEWKNVFVDMGRMGSKQCSDYFRWAYTAITRSSEKLWTYNDPEFNALSLLQTLPITKGGATQYYIPDGQNFLDWRSAQIAKYCSKFNLTFSEDRTIKYQHIFHFVAPDGNRCSVRMWYNKATYSKAPEIITTSNQEIANIVSDICEKSCIPDNLIFNPTNSLSQKLYNYIVSITKELGIPILNIIQSEWSDCYFFKTDPYESNITFHHNKKGMYSTATPQSRGGESDLLLKELCDRLR